MIFKHQQKSILSITIKLILLFSLAFSALIVASAACDIDGVSGVSGDATDNTITCDANNNPNGSRIRGYDGDDTIIIDEGANAGSVQGNGDNDTIIINGTADGVTGGDGNDIITINGVVTNNVTGNDGNDTFIIANYASIGGVIDGDGGNDTLRFSMVLCAVEGRDFDAINAVIESSAANGTITIAGKLYEWQSIENFEGNVIPEDCFVPVFNGFRDGRVNGLQCAIWIDGSIMTAYDVSGENVTFITSAMLATAPATNTLLAQNAVNNVRIYHLTSGEIQVQCDTWDTTLNQWKTDNYIFQSLDDYEPQIIR